MAIKITNATTKPGASPAAVLACKPVEELLEPDRLCSRQSCTAAAFSSAGSAIAALLIDDGGSLSCWSICGPCWWCKDALIALCSYMEAGSTSIPCRLLSTAGFKILKIFCYDPPLDPASSRLSMPSLCQDGLARPSTSCHPQATVST